MKLIPYYQKLLFAILPWLRFILIWALLWAIAGALAYYFWPQLLEKVQTYFSEKFSGFAHLSGWPLAWEIFQNNLYAVLLILFFGILFGLGPLASVGINFFVLGFLGAVFIRAGQTDIFFLSIIPHAILEIPAILLAAALGLRLGTWWLRADREYSRKRRLLASLTDNFLAIPVLALILFAAALVEALVTFQLVEKLAR